MRTIEQYLVELVSFFTSNWLAAAILGVVVIVMGYKKPKLLFQICALLGLGVVILYVLIYIEESMFSGAESKEKRESEVQRQIN